MINGDCGCRLWQPVQAGSQPKSSGLVLGRRLLGAVLHSSNEPGELSQWLCHNDSTINIVLELFIITGAKGEGLLVPSRATFVKLLSTPARWAFLSMDDI